MSREKISSLHEDIYSPQATKHLGEYTENYPERFNPKEKSTIERLTQFGIDIKSVEESLGKKIDQLTWKEYTELLAGAIKAYYDTVVGSVFDRYMFPNPESPDDKTRVKEMMEIIKEFEDMDAKFGVNLIKRKSDIKEDKNVVMGLEAGAHLIKSVSDARRLAERGIKLFGLQYGKDTTLATSEGLTKLGRDVIKDLMSKNLIIDLAHSGYRTRQDTIGIAKDMGRGHLVTYSHGCSEDDVMESWKAKVGERPLKKEEFEQIIKGGGIVGLAVSQPFFTNTRKLAERMYDISQIEGGINRIAIGSDFGGVNPEWTTEIKSVKDFKVLAGMLSEDFNIPDQDIEKIIRLNAKEWISQAID